MAVAAGEGLKAVFGDLGVDAVVSGGQTMNPSTEDILAAIQSVPAKTVLVLPNNKTSSWRPSRRRSSRTARSSCCHPHRAHGHYRHAEL